MLGKLNLTEKEDVVKFISERDVKILNLCHIPEDGRLKTLSFAVSGEKRVCEILEFGERVDGSSLFSYIDPNKSDIYIMPKLDTAFLNPFCSTKTLNILCRYLDDNGNSLDIAPENILSRAEKKLYSSTNVTLKALAELEFYVISKQETGILFPSVSERHYHESAPFSKFENLRDEILVALTDIGIATKYAHAEVGKTEGTNGTVVEQHEIELMPQNLADTAESIAIAKWVIRNICAKYGMSVSFSPKVSLEHAGNGMHIHLCGLKDSRNIIAEPEGSLSMEAKLMIGGILCFSSSLTAFGNTIPVSYLRFVSRKESPMHVCWGARNRLALIRIPLWWNFKKTEGEIDACKRTFEFRAPDPSANAYLLFAGITVATEYGFGNPEEALRVAEELHIEKIGRENRRFMLLPKSCSESAANLEKDRKYYEAGGVFPKAVIDNTIKKLKSYKDKALLQKLKNEPQKVEELMQKYLHYG
jgi:glutamine synthetase